MASPFYSDILTEAPRYSRMNREAKLMMCSKCTSELGGLTTGLLVLQSLILSLMNAGKDPGCSVEPSWAEGPALAGSCAFPAQCNTSASLILNRTFSHQCCGTVKAGISASAVPKAGASGGP